jgi:hypothetical protein
MSGMLMIKLTKNRKYLYPVSTRSRLSAKGGLISESFSLWLKSPKKGANSKV